MQIFCSKTLIEKPADIGQLPPEISVATRDLIRCLLGIEFPVSNLAHLTVVSCNGMTSVKVLSGQRPVNPTTAQYLIELKVDAGKVGIADQLQAAVIAQLLAYWQEIDQELVAARIECGGIIAALSAGIEEKQRLFLLVAKGGAKAAEQQISLLQLMFPALGYKVSENDCSASGNGPTTFIVAKGNSH